jgi:hypothetical protein
VKKKDLSNTLPRQQAGPKRTPEKLNIGIFILLLALVLFWMCVAFLIYG